ncbi:homeobox expressed in ES cells 1-like [Macrosteles quadrilineatus]|uniref:homeobox expressed in ES cells 1-like n=1 Tax=Macrosteles quadrilineatus TaxID=74068 RepID=UPI0023E29C63|nr:homeobox expressed in ES cells 1-like [Macrosteles quadrilineatus]
MALVPNQCTGCIGHTLRVVAVSESWISLVKGSDSNASKVHDERTNSNSRRKQKNTDKLRQALIPQVPGCGVDQERSTSSGVAMEATETNKDQQSRCCSTNFTIEHILQHAGRPRQDATTTATTTTTSQQLYDWLNCTRYHPPKLNRSKKKEGCVRRKLGRNPRIPFSAAQVAVLEDKFRVSPYLSTSDVGHLSTLLRLSDTRIKIWFQNRRARERRDHGKVEMVSQTPPMRHSVSEGPVKSAFAPPVPTPTTPTVHFWAKA